MIALLFGLFTRRQRMPARLPFFRSELSREDYGPVTVSLTEKEAKRCIEAIEFYIETFAPEMARRGLDKEIARYEDLQYRFMGVPEKNMKHHVEQRDEDRRT